MSKVRRVDCSGPGIRAAAAVAGWSTWTRRQRIGDVEALERIRELAIPPAWMDVWICPYPNGHIQAVGVDAAGRKQYRYHQRWRERRDQIKFDKMIEFARALRTCGTPPTGTSRRGGFPRERVLAGAVRLLDRGFFRIGGEEYAEENESYGLATIRKSHVTSARATSSGSTTRPRAASSRCAALVDPDVYDVVQALKRRRGGGHELLAYQVDGTWFDVPSTTSTRTSRRRRGATSPRRTSAPGPAPCSRRSASRSRAGRAHIEDSEEAARRARDPGGRPLPRQHAGRRPGLVHRPAGLRPLPLRRDDRRRAHRPRRRRGARRAHLPGGGRGGRPRPPRGREERRARAGRVAALGTGRARPSGSPAAASTLRPDRVEHVVVSGDEDDEGDERRIGRRRRPRPGRPGGLGGPPRPSPPGEGRRGSTASPRSGRRAPRPARGRCRTRSPRRSCPRSRRASGEARDRKEQGHGLGAERRQRRRRAEAGGTRDRDGGRGGPASRP